MADQRFVPYHWHREVTDKDGDTMVFGLRDGKVYVDVEQANGLLAFTVEGFGGFVAAAGETLAEARERAKAAPGEGVG